MRFPIILFILAASTSTSCLPEADQCYPALRYQSQTNYKVDADEVTPNGIQVDRSGQSYPTLEIIDGAVDDVEACLLEKYGNDDGNLEFPPEVMAAYDCANKVVEMPMSRPCLTVKIPNDWFVSSSDPENVQELLSYGANPVGCLQKKKRTDPDATLEDIHGCFWRAGLQCSNTIVSTPSLYVFNDPLIRTTTGCNNPWGVKINPDGTYENLAADLPSELKLTECASPKATGMTARSPLPAQRYPDGFMGHQVDFSKTDCGY